MPCDARYGHCLFHWGHEPTGCQRLCSGFLPADGINSLKYPPRKISENESSVCVISVEKSAGICACAWCSEEACRWLRARDVLRVQVVVALVLKLFSAYLFFVPRCVLNVAWLNLLEVVMVVLVTGVPLSSI